MNSSLDLTDAEKAIRELQDNRESMNEIILIIKITFGMALLMIIITLVISIGVKL